MVEEGYAGALLIGAATGAAVGTSVAAAASLGVIASSKMSCNRYVLRCLRT